MVGWEEAQHGNKVSKDTVIYSWLSEQAALDCAKQGFDVILQPGQYTYLDIVRDYVTRRTRCCLGWRHTIGTRIRLRTFGRSSCRPPDCKRILGACKRTVVRNYQ